MAISKAAVGKVAESVIPQYKPIPSEDPKVKKYQQGVLILEVSDKGKVWKHVETGKIVARGPLGKDTFEKSKNMNEKGQVLNKNGIIND